MGDKRGGLAVKFMVVNLKLCAERDEFTTADTENTEGARRISNLKFQI
jgi:hypothetical protein